MRLVRNTGNDRVIDLVRPLLSSGQEMGMVSAALSTFALAELRTALQAIKRCQLVLPPEGSDLNLSGSAADRPARNRLQTRWLAGQLAQWLTAKVDVRRATTAVPQGAMVIRDAADRPLQALLGSLAFSSDGLGVTPGNPLSLIQASEGPEEAKLIDEWFQSQWNGLSEDPKIKTSLLDSLHEIASHRDPYLVYIYILHSLFGSREGQLDEDQIVNAATGIRNTVVWQKLYKFQRDGVIGAIDKLNRFGGCIIADSVGLGKTFEALAIIKYHELRNDRVLVLCPKRLRDNWTIYKANDRRNILASDRFNYDVLNHTDLSRDGGLSGDIDLGYINWGNYDLVVIDESHNFRNKRTPQMGGETRYDRLMRKIIKEGVRTRVLMLSATPVNNRMADLRNQIAFATEADDAALLDQQIAGAAGDHTASLRHQQGIGHLQMPQGRHPPGLSAAAAQQISGPLRVCGLLSLEHPGQGHGGIDHQHPLSAAPRSRSWRHRHQRRPESAGTPAGRERQPQHPERNGPGGAPGRQPGDRAR